MLVKCAKGYVGLIFHVKHKIYLKPLCAEKCLPFTFMFRHEREGRNENYYALKNINDYS